MPIPILGTDIQNAQPYTTAMAAVPMKILSKPAEGVKCVPLSFAFNKTPTWLVNFNYGTQPVISQIACLFVDASNSTHDIDIIFPDTGYIAHVLQGKQQMIPCFTGTSIPVFYVALVNGGATSATDTCNVIAVNQFVPEFDMQSYPELVSYGYGQMYELQPTFTQSTTFTAVLGNTQFYPTAYTMINHTQWYITAINMIYTATAGAAGTAVMTLYDAGVPLLNYLMVLDNGITSNVLTDSSGLNIISSGGGPLTLKLSQVGPLTTADLSINIAGGVLVT